MKKLLITGGNGQLATEYQMSQSLQDWEFLFFDKKELDISNPKKIAAKFESENPDAVLNLAAYTNVEKAEKEETEKAFTVNATGPKNLATECKKRGIPLIHISTDYVFDGNSSSPYTEKDLENPINQYGRTKFVGEKWIQETHGWHYIIRTSWVYGNHANNFYKTMLKLAQERSELNVVEDQFGSPTSTKELCRAIDAVLKNLDPAKSGIYHFTGLGRTTWKDFAKEIFFQTKVSVRVNGVSSSSWPSKVTRPVNSYMSSEKFAKEFGYFPAHWKNALREIVAETRSIPIKVGDMVVLDDKQHVVVSTDWLKQLARIASPEALDKSIEVPFNLLSL